LKYIFSDVHLSFDVYLDLDGRPPKVLTARRISAGYALRKNNHHLGSGQKPKLSELGRRTQPLERG